MTETSMSHTARDADEHLSVADVCRRAADLARDTHGPLRRLSVRSGRTVVELEWASAAAPAQAPAATAPGGEGARTAAAAGSGTGPGSAAEDGVQHVTAVMVGTFYHAPEPGAQPFVAVGDTVDKGEQIGILEAMKLMNPIESDVRGRVVEVLVPDGTSVEYGQPLIAVAPERSQEH